MILVSQQWVAGSEEVMEQPTFSDVEYEGKKRKTRREMFLERMEALIPWPQPEERVRPHYPKAGRGRRPYELPVMLRVHCVQLFYNLSDPAMEDLLYEAESVRRFGVVVVASPIAIVEAGTVRANILMGR